MTALDQHGAGAERAQRLAVPLHLRFVGCACGGADERGGFVEVGRDESGQRQQVVAQSGDGVGRKQCVPVLGQHHGVEHDPGRTMPAQRVGHGANDAGIGEHADLHGVDADVVEDGVELRRDEFGVGRMDRAHAMRVLRGQRRDDARAVDAKRRKRLQIGLDAGSAAGVGAGDRKDIGNEA